MQTVDEKPETIHVYVVREEVSSPPYLPIFLSVFALSILLFLCVLSSSSGQPEIRKVIRIPAVFLPVKTFSALAPVIATGVKTYPATIAHGTLTITNGSVIAQEIPKGLLFTGNNGVEVITDEAVFVPAGSAAGYGVAYVPAHTTISGKAGNISALDIDSVEGSSLYIRNLSPFTGGHDAYSIKLITPQDRQAALDTARGFLATQESRTRAILVQPCIETINVKKASISVLWACQFAAYPHLPGFRITGIRIDGKSLLVAVAFTPRPMRFLRGYARAVL